MVNFALQYFNQPNTILEADEVVTRKLHGSHRTVLLRTSKGRVLKVRRTCVMELP